MVKMQKLIFKILLLSLAAIWLYGLKPSLVEDFDNRFLDYRFNSREPQKPDQRILIVGIDQNSIKKLNRPYFAFALEFAKVVDLAREAGSAGLLFDLVLPPSSESAIKDHVASVSAEVGLELPHRFYRLLGFDQALRRSLIQLKNSITRLVIGFAYEEGQNFIADSAILRIARAESTGFFNLPVDRDGRIRRALLKARSDDAPVRSVAALTATALATNSAVLESEEYQHINFRGPAGTFATISLTQLLDQHESSSETLKNKLVLIGFTDITDTKSTPFGYMPGVEIHANIIDNILNHRFLSTVQLPIEILIILLLLVIVSLVSLKNQLLGTALAIFSATAWVITPSSLFPDLVTPVFRPVFLLLLLAATDLYDFIRRVYLDRRRIRTVFSRYVSDSVLHEILAATDQDFLSGKRRRLCILMADIRGFTTFSESREATEVVKFLNAYFARVTEIIMQNGGVVDKFLGDGLLAFFNAPVEHPDFADQALKAAIQIRNFAESPEFESICGNAGLKVGIALNIGSVVFGNIGSEKKAEFTVIGDAVNSCSRMESLNKDFATDIIVSEDVVKECKTEVEWKLLGKKSLRGKSQEISLYTLIKSGRA